jgi:hypothetical protein
MISAFKGRAPYPRIACTGGWMLGRRFEGDPTLKRRGTLSVCVKYSKRVG